MELVRQAQIYGAFMWQLFGNAGIAPGVSVLDLDSGAGDVPRRRVSGLDMSA